MWRNYFLVAIRQFGRHRSNNLVNVLGLAFGLACCMMCYVHLRFQYSFDSFHNNGERTFRLVTGDPASTDSWIKAPAPLPQKLKSEIPGIESYTRLNSVSWNEKVTVEAGNNRFLEPSFMMADQNFFQTFSFPLVKGDAATVLSDPSGVVINESTARRLFGTDEPINKLIRLKDSGLDFRVTGVMKDLPANTHVRANYIVSFANLERIFGKGRSEAWGENNYFAYLTLAPSASSAEIQKKIQSVIIPVPSQDALSLKEYRLQPITDIHFQHNRGNLLPSYDERYLYIFLTLAISILLIATMNYFNLATMISLRRIKEVGVRKSIGASGRQLAKQMIGENFMTVTFSLAVGLLLLMLLRPVTSWALDSPLVVDYTDPWFLVLIVSVVMLLGTLSGSYLAFYVNSFRPGMILKGASTGNKGSSALQRTLILVQFTISLILLSSSFVVTRQMQLVHNKNLGFDYEGVITVALSSDLSPQQVEVLKTELRKSSHVSDVATSDFTPGRANWHQSTWWEGQGESEMMFVIAADRDFVRAMRMELIEGSGEELAASAGTQYLINESAREQIGWTTARGKMLSPFGESRKLPVAGVVKDFNFSSLHHVVGPLVVVVFNDRKFSQLSVRLAGNAIAPAIDEVGNIYKNVSGGMPFEFKFMDESIANLYKAENQMNGIIVFLAFVAVAFSLLGIYALISFAIENRTKEIAIRKVLGVDVSSLIKLFSLGYVRLALIAAFIAVPVTWSLLGDWLTRFDYRVDLNPAWFAVAVLVLIGSILGIGLGKFASMASVSPAESLKHE